VQYRALPASHCSNVINNKSTKDTKCYNFTYTENIQRDMLVTVQPASYRMAQEATPKMRKADKNALMRTNENTKLVGKKMNTQSVVFKGHALQ
jgi:hypothetical protein